MEFLRADQLAFILGLLGNIISFLVFLAPVPIFYKIYEKGSSEGYQIHNLCRCAHKCIFVVILRLCQDRCHSHHHLNAFGCAIEIIYVVLHLIYAPKHQKLVVAVRFWALTLLLFRGSKRVAIVGCICAAFTLAVFVAPLSIARRVIKTKSVEYMPFTLSLFLTMSATSWFFYGIFIGDLFTALPNVVGFLFGIAQMILYMIYKNAKDDEAKLKPGNDQPQVQETNMVDRGKILESTDNDV